MPRTLGLLLSGLLSFPLFAQTAASADQARVIVKFKASTRPAAQAAPLRQLAVLRQAASLGVRIGRPLRDGATLAERTQLIHASGVDSARLAAELAADPAVEYAVPDRIRRAHAIPTDPLYGSNTSAVALPYTPAVGQWYLRKPTASAPATTTQLVSSIDAETAWSLQTGSSGIVVAVLDSGVRPDHPDLSGRLVAGRDFLSNSWMAGDGDGWDGDPTDLGDGISAADIAAHQATSADPCFGLTSADASSSDWHGTQVAALIAANHDRHGMAGVAPGVGIMPLRVLGKCGGYDSDIIAAARWAVNLPVVDPATGSVLPGPAVPARILNLSLGGVGNCSAAYRDLVSAVQAQGALLVVSAGNDGGAVNTPGNCDGVIAVGGTDHSGLKGAVTLNGGVTFASSLGRHVTLTAPMGDCVNVVDPVARQACLYPIVSAANPGDPGPVPYSEPSVAMFFSGDFSASAANGRLGVGTSFAAPLVSGAAALVWSSSPTLTAAQVRSILQGSSRLNPSKAGVRACVEPSSNAIYQTQPQGTCICTTETCGAGMLDAGAAVKAVVGGAQLFALIEGMPAVVNFDPSATTATSVTLTGSAFRAGTGGAMSALVPTYRWALGSGSTIAWMPTMTGTASQVFRVSGAGTFTVRLTVTDANGVQASSSQTLTVEAVSPSGGGSTTGGGSTGGGTAPTGSSSTQSGLALDWPEAVLAAVLIALSARRRRLWC